MELTLLATGVTALRAADQFDSLVKLAQALPPDTAPELVLVIVGVDEALARRAGELADERALPGYDAVHLASALALGSRRRRTLKEAEKAGKGRWAVSIDAAHRLGGTTTIAVCRRFGAGCGLGLDPGTHDRFVCRRISVLVHLTCN